MSVPQVLMLGQYSTGKTTFIKALLGREYPGNCSSDNHHLALLAVFLSSLSSGTDINAAASTDKFFAIHRGQEDDEIPGTALVTDLEMNN